MDNSKIILVACISAFVAITTAFLGVTGTIIGSVLSSVLYNVLSEMLEKPVSEKKFSFNFEYEIAYVFPLVIIAFIQFLLIAAFLSQWGFLPGTFLNVYLQIQNIVDNNLYRVLGVALIVMGIYPFIIRPNIVKKSYGVIVGFIGVIFLARGFVDAGLFITDLYAVIFHYLDFPIEVFAFVLLVAVILLILNNASKNNKDFKIQQQRNITVKKVNHDNRLKNIPTKKFDDYDEFKDDYIPYNRRTKSPVNNDYDMEKYQLKRRKKYTDINYNDYLPSPKRNPLNKDNKESKDYEQKE